MSAIVGAVVFLCALSVDFAHARYVVAVGARRGARAAAWSLAAWAASVACLYVAVRVSWWMLVPEGAGLFAGTFLSVRSVDET